MGIRKQLSGYDWNKFTAVAMAILLVSASTVVMVQFGGELSPMMNASAEHSDGDNLYEDFENDTFNTESGKWYWDGDGEAQTSNTTGAAYNGSWGMLINGDGDSSIQKPIMAFDQGPSPSSLKFYMSYSSGTNSSGSEFKSNLRRSGNIFAEVHIDDNNFKVAPSNTSKTTIGSSSADTWYKVRYHNINYTAETYDITVTNVETGSAIGTVSGVSFYNGNSASQIDAIHWNGMADGNNEKIDFLATNGLKPSDTRSFSSGDVSGQVVTQDDVPVSNATVEVVGVDYANLSGSPSEKREQAKEYARFAEKVKPTSYQQTTQPQDLLTSKQYVAVHPARAWGMNSEIKSTDDAIQNIAGNPKLGFASSKPGPYGGAATAEPGQLLTLTVWDTEDAGFIQDGVSRDLPGGIDDDTRIVVEKLGPGPDAVTDREVYDTDRSYDVVGIGGEHDFAYARLSEGFYRVYPENNSEVAYVVAVGNPDDIAAAYRDDLKDKSNSLTKQAKEISNFYENNTFRKVTVSTNETGHYNASLPSSTVNLTTVRAYKLPADANVDPKNATMQDARNYYEGVDVNNSTSVPSIYLPGETETVTPPKSGVTVTVREAPQSLFGLDIAKSEARLDALAEYFFGKSFSELSSVLQEDIQNLDRERLEALYEEYADRATVSDDYRNRANANYDGAGDVIVDVNNSTSAELRERMTALEDANNELRETIEGSSEIGDTTNNSVSVGFDFGEDLTSEQVTVLARYSNGTTRVVNDSYLTFDDGPFGAGSTTVRVVDYPLGDTDPAQVSFRADVVTPDGGHGSETINVRNPTYSGDVPKLDAIALSSLQPGANDRVNVSLKPESPSEFGQLVSVDVTGPDGNAISTGNISGESTSFTTNGKGEYLIRATYTDANGNNFVATTRLEALDTDLSRPAGIRAKHSPVGMYAVAGDGFQSGDVERARGGARLTITGQVPADSDPPPSYHVYADGMEQPPEATTCTRVTRGSSEEVVRQRMGANIHVKKLPDDALVWRFDESGTAQPVTTDGSTSTYEMSENGTTISTFTNADGSVCIKTDTDVSRWERALFEFRQIGIPLLSMTVVDSVASPMASSATNGQVAG